MFQTPYSTIVSGPSSCGKTTLLKKILLKYCYQYNVYFFFKNWQPLYEDIAFEHPKVRFFHYNVENNKNYNDDNLLEKMIISVPAHSTFVFDDGREASKAQIIEDFFTRMCHHYNCNVFLLTQNLFDPKIRVMARNASYMIIFRSPRDAAQIRCLAYQIYLECDKAKALIKTFHEITSKPFGYMLLDFKPGTRDDRRIASEVLSDSPLFYCFQENPKVYKDPPFNTTYSFV